MNKMAFFLPLLIGGSAIGGIASWLFNVDTGEVIEGAVETVTEQIPIIIEATVPALIDGVIGGVMAVGEAFEGREQAFFKMITVLAISYVGFRTLKMMTSSGVKISGS